MPLTGAEKTQLIADIAAVKAAVDALVPDAAAPPVDDAHQDSPVPDADWQEGTPGSLDVVTHFSSPSGRPLVLTAISTLPSGVTLSATGLVYDGVGSFRVSVADVLDVSTH